MNKSYSILFLIDSLSEGGSELALLILVQTLCKQNCRVSVFSFREPSRLAVAFSEAGAILYMPAIGVSESRFGAFMRLKKVLKKDYFDFLHASSRNTSMFLGLGFMLPSHGRRVVTFQDVHFRRNPVLTRWQRIKEYILLSILRFTCNGFTTDSKQNVADYNKYSSNIPVIHLPNCVVPVSTAQVNESVVRELMGVFINDFVIIIPARYSVQKGHIVFFAALCDLRSRGVPLPRVVCYGAGDQLPSLSKYLIDNKLEHKVTLNGIVPIDELQLFMCAADLVVVPSLWESFGQVVIGAMALGKPVLGSDTGGIREQITHDKTGFLAPAGDAVSWSFEVERLLNSPTKLLTVGKSAKEAVRRIATPEDIGCKLINYYSKLR